MLKGLLTCVLWLLAFFALIIGLMMLPSPQPEAPKPWEIILQPDNTIEVFGVHIGQTTYQQAEALWRERNEAAIFATTEGTSSAEVFFEQLNLSGLSARIVLTLDVEQSTLLAMQERATSGLLQPSGARRYVPNLNDRQLLLTRPIYAITYVPSVKLDSAMLTSRFGHPEQMEIDLNDSDAELWLYPHLGLTVRLHPKDRTVFTYQNPETMAAGQ